MPDDSPGLRAFQVSPKGLPNDKRTLGETRANNAMTMKRNLIGKGDESVYTLRSTMTEQEIGFQRQTTAEYTFRTCPHLPFISLRLKSLTVEYLRDEVINLGLVNAMVLLPSLPGMVRVLRCVLAFDRYRKVDDVPRVSWQTPGRSCLMSPPVWSPRIVPRVYHRLCYIASSSLVWQVEEHPSRHTRARACAADRTSSTKLGSDEAPVMSQ